MHFPTRALANTIGLYTECFSYITTVMRLICTAFVADLSNGDSLKSLSVFNRDNLNTRDECRELSLNGKGKRHVSC
jgi:hypothetical protein